MAVGNNSRRYLDDEIKYMMRSLPRDNRRFIRVSWIDPSNNQPQEFFWSKSSMKAARRDVVDLRTRGMRNVKLEETWA